MYLISELFIVLAMPYFIKTLFKYIAHSGLTLKVALVCLIPDTAWHNCAVNKYKRHSPFCAAAYIFFFSYIAVPRNLYTQTIPIFLCLELIAKIYEV
jgi:hypothetical protein